MTDISYDSMLDKVLAPIAGENPAGADARYEPEYEAIQAEIEKLSSITRSSGCDWRAVADNAVILLGGKSKDYQAACYLAVALGHLDGGPGVLAGSRLLGGLVRDFWQTGFPLIKRIRGRANAFEWWRERTLELVQARQDGPPLPAETADGLVAGLKELDGLLADALPDFAPLRALIDAASRLPVVAPPPAADAPAPPGSAPGADAPGGEAAPSAAPAPVASAAATPAAPVPAGGTPAAPPVFTDDMAANRRAFGECALSLARAAHAADLADPLGWQALRIAVWGGLTQPPPAENGATMIPAPAAERKAALTEQIANGGAREAAIAIEDLIPAAPFWLDLQRLAARALEALGAPFAPALMVVAAETGLLVRRLPGIEGFSFADGMPLADGETREWLAGLAGGGAKDGAPAGGAPGTPAAIAEAGRLYAAGNLGAALATLEAAGDNARGALARLPLRIAQARLLGQDGRWAAATGIAEELWEQCIGGGLARWSPELAIEALTVVHRIWNGLGGERGRARAWETAQALARISPSAALAAE